MPPSRTGFQKQQGFDQNSEKLWTRVECGCTRVKCGRQTDRQTGCRWNAGREMGRVWVVSHMEKNQASRGFPGRLWKVRFKR